MRFGDWIRKLRTDQDLTLVQLAEQVGLTHPAISLIETNRSRPILTSAKQLCEALGATLADLMWITQERKDLHYLETATSSQEHKVLDLDDVEAFLALHRHSDAMFKALFAELLNTIAMLRAEDAHIAGDRPLSVSNVDTAIFTHPLYAPSWFPVPTPPETVLQTYERGGALASRDLVIYLIDAYKRVKPDLEDAASLYKVINSVKRRSSDDLVVQVLLEDVLALDEALVDDGEILAMFWRVAELGELLDDRGPEEERLVSILIKAYRWWQHYAGWDDTSWLEHLRRGIGRSELVTS